MTRVSDVDSFNAATTRLLQTFHYLILTTELPSSMAQKVEQLLDRPLYGKSSVAFPVIVLMMPKSSTFPRKSCRPSF
jgi:hypothetical protein